MTDSKFSTIRSSYSSVVDSLDIEAQLAELDNLLDDYEFLPTPSYSSSKSNLSSLSKFSKSALSLNISSCEDNVNGTESFSWGNEGKKPLHSPVFSRASLGKFSTSEINLNIEEPQDSKSEVQKTVKICKSQAPKPSRANMKKSFHSEVNLTQIEMRESPRLKEIKQEARLGSLFIPKSERQTTTLGRFSKSHLILTDIDIDGEEDAVKCTTKSSSAETLTQDDKEADREVENFLKSNEKTFSGNNSVFQPIQSWPDFPMSSSTSDGSLSSGAPLMNMTCFGKVGNRTATKMFIPPAVPTGEEARKVKEMQEKKAKQLEERKAKEKATIEVLEKKQQEQDAKKAKELELKKAQAREEKRLKEVEEKRLREIEEKKKQEIEAQQQKEMEERMAKELAIKKAQDAEAKRVEDLKRLNDMEEQMAQLGKMIGQFPKIKNAKEIAYEQGVKTLKRHTSEFVNKIYQIEQQMLEELEDKHKKDLAEVEETEQKLADMLEEVKNDLAAAQTGLNLALVQSDNQRDSGYAEFDSEESSEGSREKKTEQVAKTLEDMFTQVPNVIWSQRSVVRFVTADKTPKLGAFQECYMSEDYSKVTKCKAYCQDHPGFECTEKKTKPINEEAGKPSKDSLQRRRAQSMMILRHEERPQLVKPAIERPPLRKLFSKPKLLYRLFQKGSHSGGIHQPVDACFLPNGNILIAEAGNSRLQEFNSAGESVQVINPVPFKPCGVALTKEGYIAATDAVDKNIKVFTRGGDLVCKFGTGYFKDPSAVSLTNTDLYIINENVGPWQQFMFQYSAMTGVKTKIGYDERNTYIINAPEYSYVDKTTGDILISDSGLHCIWVFNKDLTLKRSFGSLGNGRGELSHPKGVCCDHEGNILVADCANHRVVKFSPTGEYLEEVVGSGQGLNYPLVVHVSREGSRMVVVQNSDILLFQVYE